jgi:site-specific DNA recombinase
MEELESGKIDVVVVYKVDRLSRSLLDFARLLEIFERQRVSFVSVTQQFNTAQSLGRLVLNMLLSFAQFEREMIAERTRDKMCAARKKGKWIGDTSSRRQSCTTAATPASRQRPAPPTRPKEF